MDARTRIGYEEYIKSMGRDALYKLIDKSVGQLVKPPHCNLKNNRCPSCLTNIDTYWKKLKLSTVLGVDRDCYGR